MSDKPIAVGDLVMVVRWPCCGSALGRVGVVRGFDRVAIDGGCVKCTGRKDAHFGATPAAAVQVGKNTLWPVAWLKRLDPDALKDDVPTREELTA